MNTCYLSFGSNLGNRFNYIVGAVNELRQSGCVMAGLSRVYESSAWGFEGATTFLNCVIQIQTHSQSRQLFDLIREIETSLHRKIPNIVFEDRVIDIDMLFWNDEIITSDDLCIPHPLLHLREFCIRPLCDINPGLIHPVLKISMSDILEGMAKDELTACVMNTQDFKQLFE